MVRTGSRRPPLAVALGLVLAVAAGCGGSSSGRGPIGATAAPSGSGSTASPSSPASPAPPAVPADPLTPATRLEVARAFAPRLRFNAYHDDGDRTLQNRNEDFFPMGVASFFREVTSGQVRIATRESVENAPAETLLLPIPSVTVFGPQALGDYPERMVGDAPGSAPVYVHVYEDLTGRSIGPDGSGEIVVHAEYWLFYAYDRAEARLFGLPLPSSFAIGNHRADWEHTAYRIRVRLGPGSLFADGDVLEGYFYGHGRGLRVPGPEVELVDDAGAPDPAGTHPVVYIAQGKHASYPEAGHWPTHDSFPGFLAEHTDFFRGNGVVVDTWHADLVDLEDPGARPDEFDTPEIRQVMAASPVAGLPDWSQYMGRWGPDNFSIGIPNVFTRIIMASPDGPKAKGSYGDAARVAGFELWSDAKTRDQELVSYRDRGITIPDVAPPPLPIRN